VKYKKRPLKDRESVAPLGDVRDGGAFPCVEGGVLFLLKGYPRLSETFIAQEIRALEMRGLNIRIASLRLPTDEAAHPVHGEIAAPVHYLPEYLHQAIARVLRGWWRARRLPGYGGAVRVFFADLMRDFTRNRFRRFGQACVLAAELPEDVRHLHAHFLHTPASVACYVHLMTGLPWSCSAHAKDIWTTPDWEKREKLARLSWLVTCTAAGHKALLRLAPDPDKVRLVYHGLDFRRFPAPPERDARDYGRMHDAHGPAIILSIGRAVEKKGYDDLLRALALLPPALDWRFQHIGGGPLLDGLRAEARALGIESRIEWLGPQPQQRVIEALRRADLFVLANRIGGDGDRDGLPNVLMEAASQRLAVIASDVSGAPEFIRHEETGILIPPGEPRRCAEAIVRLLGDGALRKRLGEAGFLRVRSHFAMEHCIDDLAQRFGLPPQPVSASSRPLPAIPSSDA